MTQLSTLLAGYITLSVGILISIGGILVIQNKENTFGFSRRMNPTIASRATFGGFLDFLTPVV